MEVASLFDHTTEMLNGRVRILGVRRVPGRGGHPDSLPRNKNVLVRTKREIINSRVGV
jgi:hypothetical protein